MLPPPGLGVASEIVRLFREGDPAGAAERQTFFAEFPSRWLRLGLGPAVRAAMDVVGCPVGPPLPPYDSLLQHEQDEMQALFSTSVPDLTQIGL